MDYELRTTKTGLFEIVQLRPVTVGTFPDKEIAMDVMLFLADKQSVSANAPVQTNAPLEAPEESEATPEVPTVAGDDWTEAELRAAFEAFESGEPLKTIARRYGKGWTKLRSQWAAHKRRTKSRALVPVSSSAQTPIEQEKTLAEVVKSAIEELNDQARCTVCQRPFTAGPDNLDLCARCRHDA